MMPSLGLSLGLGGVRVLGAAGGPPYDPDAAAWFEAVEATGATFGPDSATANANKMAWSDWVVAQKNAESPIAGRTNWQQLTQEDEGFIQPLMGLSTFNVPPMFGGRTFTGFVAGDYIPALGLKGGVEKVLLANRTWNSTPLNDVAAGVWVTEAGGNATGRIIGNAISLLVEDTRSSLRGLPYTAPDSTGPGYNTGTFPRSAFLNRYDSAFYEVYNGQKYTFFNAANDADTNFVSFFARPSLNADSTVRGGLAFYGRSINLEAMNTACVALSEAITWPT